MAALVWEVGHIAEQARVLTAKLVEELRARKPEGAEAVGITILHRVQEAYGVKARGGVGSDGIVWPDLKPATIRARMNRLKRFKNLAKAAKRKKLEKLTLDGGYEIGVDTGLQINSASPGFTDPTWNRTPSDSLGHNVFVVDAGNVTIGYDRTYSAAFDRDRKLIPETLPAPWEVEAEEAFTTWADLIIQAEMN